MHTQIPANKKYYIPKLAMPKIPYFLVLETDELEDITPFQGFSRSWHHLNWALSILPYLPSDLIERTHSSAALVSQIVSKVRSIDWYPISLANFVTANPQEFPPLTVCFVGETKVAEILRKWITFDGNILLLEMEVILRRDQNPVQRVLKLMLSHLQRKIDSEVFDPGISDLLKKASENWFRENNQYSVNSVYRHNITRPNHMSLIRYGTDFKELDKVRLKSEEDFTKIILDSAEQVLNIRKQTKLSDFHRLNLIKPSIILAEPALMRGLYEYENLSLKQQNPIAYKTLKRIQKQRDFYNEISESDFEDLKTSEEAQTFLQIRKSELDTFTLGVGLFACQTYSAVLRISPEINRIFGHLKNFGIHIRAIDEHLPFNNKAAKIFKEAQNSLQNAIGSEKINHLAKGNSSIKIISDAPIELMPIGNLPLSLRYSCSRINATPGNLLMGLLALLTLGYNIFCLPGFGYAMSSL